MSKSNLDIKVIFSTNELQYGSQKFDIEVYDFDTKSFNISVDEL
jgi:hypothetical protein